ncbi:unnamed protein product [Caenorhabditis auriculariae]|uniref:Diacylglycerol kinase n=1 Tax=Caenorhabditis auriculariae TaxID=2777116 RepID=A0A8S1HLK3_9PELO|nr:unnamed protein product [Caenorhabditis auriculariae]
MFRLWFFSPGFAACENRTERLDTGKKERFEFLLRADVLPTPCKSYRVADRSLFFSGHVLALPVPRKIPEIRIDGPDSSRKLKDMLCEFQPEGKFYHFLSEDTQTICFEGFQAFLQDYFGAELPSDLIDQLFFSFSKPPIKERRTSVFEDAISTVKAKFTESLSGRLEKLSMGQHDVSPGPPLDRIPEDAMMVSKPVCSSQEPRIPLKPLICTLSLLEADTPENKLEVVFHVYDSDANGFLDKAEIDGIIEQMMNVARYQQWDTIELEQVLRQMMADIDYDNDGIVSLDEWRRGGLTNIPLLVLLGFDTEMKEDGSHAWRLRHFSKPTYCNACCSLLVGWGGKQGLSCSLCKYTVHERCVRSAANNCIRTFSSRQQDKLYHHWQDANTTSKCVKCRATVGAFQGKRCRWCHNYVHHRCMSFLPQECDLGTLAYHILPPTHIFPAFLERKSSSSFRNNHPGSGTSLLQALSPGQSVRPLLVLVNPKSGGKQGIKILQKFEYLLNPRQVYDLCKTGPEPGLQLFASLPNSNVLVCGGDGTIGWVLESMDKMTFPHGRPPVAVLPLGTGNDLARCLRWGGGYENESLYKILQQIEKATLIEMDRWQIKIEPSESKSGRKSEKGDPPPYNIINNYFSIGVDASIAHRFHVMREKFPEKFNSRMRNKLWYFELGTSETLSSSCKNLHEQIDILCDGESIDLGQDASLEGIALLNIHSIYGGSNLWGRSRKGKPRMPTLFHSTPSEKRLQAQLQNRVQDIGDGLIELVGLESAIQMGQIKAGVRGARRLSQCSTVVIQTHKSFPMQIDGEPWMQPPCIIQITNKNQVKMLVAPRKRSSWSLLKRQDVSTRITAAISIFLSASPWKRSPSSSSPEMTANGNGDMNHIEDPSEDVEILGPPEPIDIPSENEHHSGPETPKDVAPSPFPDPNSTRIDLLDCNANNGFIYQLYIQGDFLECKALIGETQAKFDGKCEYAMNIRGCIAREEGQLMDALEWFEKAFAASGRNYKYYIELGRVNVLLGRHAVAVEQLELAAQNCPENPKVFFWLARALCGLEIKSKDFNPKEKARDLLMKSPLIGTDPLLLKYLAEVLEELNDFPAAVAAYKGVLELQPENIDVMVKLGLLHLRAGDEDPAFAILGQCLAFDPTNAEAILALGSIMQVHGDHDVALNKYRVAASVCDYNGCLWNNIGVGMLARDKLAAAHSSLKKAAYIMPLDYKINFNLGVLHESMGLNCSALFFLKKAADLKRDDPKLIGAMAGEI